MRGPTCIRSPLLTARAWSPNSAPNTTSTRPDSTGASPGVNGRDFFHNPQGDYWRRVSATVTQQSGDEVRWQTVYDLLDDRRQHHPDRDRALVDARTRTARFVLDLEWRGEARTDVTVGKYDYGGLFLRMPWREGMPARSSMPRGSATNAPRASARCGSTSACRSKAATISRTSRSSIIRTTPATLRPGESMASSASAQRDRAQADWTIKKGETEVVRHRFVVYTGTLNDVELTAAWSEYGGNRSTSRCCGRSRREKAARNDS